MALITKVVEGSFELAELWPLLDGPIYYVVDEQGVCVANGQVRHFWDDYWIYRDDSDGYSLISSALLDDLDLFDTDPKRGWDAAGNVIDL
jgi:hypothetical protein